jgi:hypothetical protein
VDEVIALDFIDLGAISFFSLYHRKCYKKENYRSSDTKVFGFETKKSKKILSEYECSDHRDKENETKSHSIFSIFSWTRIRMKFCVERKGGERLKECNERKKHRRDSYEVDGI